jgi:SAM-dependent methyltransferase
MSLEPTTRFSARAPYYHRYRPRYPRAILDVLETHGLTPQAVVADVGAGTGISSELFLDYGCPVYAVEPNAEMRAACVQFYSNRPLQVINGAAEATTLASHTIDWVVAGQAFHWFDHAAAKAEFARILRLGGRVALFWNDRIPTVSDFVNEYNAVLDDFDIEKGTPSARAKELLAGDDVLDEFFAPHGFELHNLSNPVEYDWDGLQGRALSASYAPLPDHPRHAEMITALRTVYDRHQRDGLVQMDYVTKLYIGRV